MDFIPLRSIGAVRIFVAFVLCFGLSATSIPKQGGGCSPSTVGTQFADVTGDGKADAIAINKNGITVRPSDGTQFLPNEIWSSVGYYGSDPSGIANIYFADVTGDGKADAIVSNPRGIDVRPSDGRKFLANQAWTTNAFFGSDQFGRHNLYFADVDGDHKADAIVANRNRIEVRRSDGHRFLPNEAWTNEPYFGERGTFFADVDGDGKADAIVVNRDGITVRRSDGNHFLPNEVWAEGLTRRGKGWGRRWEWQADQNAQVYFADVDGDGKADAIFVHGNGITVRLSDGARFLPEQRWISGAYMGGVGTYFVDVTGDGKADAVAVNTNATDIRRSDGAQFLPNERWITGAYYGEISPVCR